ncbi:MAG TPA: hypothetical protein VHG28_19245 [Longimicrobiaceae bacterium]|nr:hypothetical protein [Longimicrobiaceae bacterium]
MHELDRVLGEYESSDEFEFLNESEWTPETDTEAVFDEVEEMELAAELLEVTDEQELEQFLGKLVKAAGKAVGGFIKSPVGQALGGVLKNVAKTALPMAGAALGNLVAPGVGGAIGGKLASAAGQMFGLELEGMSPQDQEFEVARRIVRLAGSATQNAAQAPAGVPPVTVAKDAVLAAAQQHAPGLLGGAVAAGQGRCTCGRRSRSRAGSSVGGGGGVGGGSLGGGSFGGAVSSAANGVGGGTRGGTGQSGRWIRKGSTIVLFGV